MYTYKNQFRLLARRKFLPLFITQFLGAFNDNIFKNSLVVLITYSLAAKYSYDVKVIITIAAGIFILPWILFSAISGQIADKYDKSTLITIVKFAEIIIMLLACIGFYFENVRFLLCVLFLMGVHSSFFGPLKYSILPQHLTQNELIGGNALIQTATFIAILFGTILGTIIILKQHGIFATSVIVVLVALFGWLASLLIPRAPASDNNIKIDLNIIRITWTLLKYSAKSKTIFSSIIGISWLWFLGATYLSQFPAYVKEVLNGREEIIALLLTAFSAGIGIGSLLCNSLLKGQIKTKYVLLGAIGMAVFGIDFYFASNAIASHAQIISSSTLPTQPLLTLTMFLSSLKYLRILLDLTLIAIAGGIYVVPLYALLQVSAKDTHKARIIACNNIMNAIFMVLSALIIIVLLKVNFSISEIFLIVSLLTFYVTFYLRKFTKN